MRILLFSILTLVVQVVCLAQDVVRCNIRGIVYESQELKPMEGVAVKLFEKDTVMLVGNVTNQHGQFLLPAVPVGTYQMRVSFMGYKEQIFTVKLPEKGGNYKVADVLLREQTTMMEEAVVVGQAPEMMVVEDTVMYSVSAFKLPEGALIEELLKRLPGITLEDDGRYLWNGKEVTQILVDGKEFFGRNMDVILKNIPVDIVDKVKAYDRKSDQARITGIDDGNERTVLDLAIKKNMKKGWFGNVEGGYGMPDNRYNGRVMVNRFKGDQKFAIISNANNTEGNGLTDRQTVGATMNIETKTLELNGSVNGNFSQASNETQSNSQNFENRNAAYSNRENYSMNNNKAFNFNYKVEWKPDSSWNILFRPELSYDHSRNEGGAESATFNENPYSIPGIKDPLRQLDLLRGIGVNHNLSANHGNGDNFSARASLQVNKRLAKPGRNLTFAFEGGYGSNANTGDSYNQIDYYQLKAITGEDSIYHKVQFNDGRNLSHNMTGRFSYSEPIAQQVYLQLNYSFNYSFRDNDRTVSSIFDPWNERWGVNVFNYRDFIDRAERDTAQCSYTTNRYYNHDIRLQLRVNRTKCQLTVGVNMQPQRSVLDYTKGWKHYDVERTVMNVAPAVNFRYRFSRQEQLDFRYNGNTGQPNLTDMIPDTLNNANPLNIRLGNAELVPSFTHNMQANYRRNIPDLQRTYALNAQFRTTQNSVTNMTTYNDQTGARVSMPVNVSGNWNASASFNFNTAFTGDQRFRINTNTQWSMTQSNGFVYRSQTHETLKNQVTGTNIREYLRLTFRNDLIEVNLNGSIRYNHSRATATSASNLDTYNFSYGASTTLNLPWNMTISTDIGMNSRRGYNDESMNTNELIWNASIAQRLLKKKNLTLSVRAYDILGQRDNVNRSVSATARTDTRTQSIHQYVIFSVNFRFGQFGGRRSGARPAREEADGNGNREGERVARDGDRGNRERVNRGGRPRGGE